MTKQETQMVKGIAILFMLFLHLFNSPDKIILCQPLIIIGNDSFAYILTRAVNPVSFFLILGGYGLYYVNRDHDKHRFTRIAKLYIHYWLIMLIMVSIGNFMIPNRYPGTITTIIANLTSFNTTYNGECWFLLPYSIISLCAVYIFKCFKFIKDYILLAVTFIAGIGTSYLISRHGAEYLYNNMWLYNPVLVIHLLFPFMLGAVAAKRKLLEKSSKYLKDKGLYKYLWIMIIAIIAIRCLFTTSAFHTIYAFILIMLFIPAHRPKFVNTILEKLGNNSMNMWFIHTYISWYLFRDFIYGFKYPIIIYLVLIILSYVSSLIIDKIAKPITTFLFDKKKGESIIVR